MPFMWPRDGLPARRKWGKRGPRLGSMPRLVLPDDRRDLRQRFDGMVTRDLP